MMDYIFSIYALSQSNFFLLCLCASLIGAAKTGLGGVAIPVIAIMATIFGPKESTGIVLLLMILADIFGVYFYHSSVNIKIIKHLSITTVLGILFGVLTGNVIKEQLFAFILGVIILIGTLIMVINLNNNIKISKNHYIAPFIGILSGFATMIGNAAGPIVSIYFLTLGLNKKNFLGTTALFFFFVNLFKVPFHIYFWDTIYIKTIFQALFMLPFIFIGALIGYYTVKMFSEDLFKKIIIFFVILSTIQLFLKIFSM